MNLTTEQQNELALFPSSLRTLIEAELAAGNSVVEVGHSFPAPPAGAYFKLANKVSTRDRMSGDGLRFYERTGSDYSGEFTDARRFYFVLEPPNPPPPEPDMDAIRRALEPKEETMPDIAAPPGTRLRRSVGKRRAYWTPGDPAADTPGGHSVTQTPNGAIRVLHFCDERPPQEIQFALERELMSLFTITMIEGRLTLRGKALMVGARYDFDLRFESALPRKNAYSLRVETSWDDQATSFHDYFRKTSESWFRCWTRDLEPSRPMPYEAGSPALYQKLCDAALRAEEQFGTVAAVQQAIVDGMKQGSYFSTSHKEGGTHLRWLDGRFRRSDYGDYPGGKIFSTEGEFLAALRQFYDFETSQNCYPHKVSEMEAWKLILRLLRPR